MDWKTTIKRRHMWLTILFVLGPALFPALGWSQAPIFEITPVDSRIKLHVKASVRIAGKFDKWDAGLTFKSPDETTGLLEIRIDAASVDTGSGMKNGKLKSKDFFDVEQNPYITFKSTKIVPTGPHTYEVDGDFTIRGVSNPEKLILTSRQGNRFRRSARSDGLQPQGLRQEKGRTIHQDCGPCGREFPSQMEARRRTSISLSHRC